MLEWEPATLTRLEQLVLNSSDYPASMGLEEATARVRQWLRREIDRRLRETAKKETVELKCDCGEIVHVSVGYAEKVSYGAPSPKCFDCKRPAQAAEAQAEAVQFVALVGDSDEELQAAIAQLL